MWFTTSWDDGHPLDLKLAELLHRHGIAGTFYCPSTNSEGLPTLDAAGLRCLESAHCEIGGHTLDHAYATRMSEDDWATQVRSGKDALEQVLGHRISGFCYPGGKHPGRSRQVVIDSGFDYARTVRNFCLHPGTDRFLIPTTLQLYEHSSSVLWRNLVLGGQLMGRANVASKVLTAEPDLLHRLEALLDFAARGGDDVLLHFWGHSWEIEAAGLWSTLDQAFAMVARQVPAHRRVTNLGAMQALNLVPATLQAGRAADTPGRAYPSCP